MPVYSLKQRAVLQLRARKHVNYHLFDGAVRSGKTFSAVGGFVNWALSLDSNRHPYMIASKTYAQVRDILVPEFADYAESIGAPFRLKRGESKFYILDREFIYKDGGSPDAAAKIKGFTFPGVFVDEATECREDFLIMAASRCLTYDNFKVVMTCNPDGPAHWMKLHYVDRAEFDERYERIPFTLYDNPTLKQTDLETLIGAHSELWRRRMLRGEWVAATGAVYPYWTQKECPHIGQQPILRWVGLDSALSGVDHAILFEQHDDKVYAIDEWRHDGRQAGPLKLDRKPAHIERWIGDRPVDAITVDPATPNSVKLDLAERMKVPVLNAINDVADGINATAGWLENEWLYVSGACVETIREMQSYVWDEKAAERGEDKPVKVNDHGPDALRYGVATYRNLRRYGRGRVNTIPHALDDN